MNEVVETITDPAFVARLNERFGAGTVTLQECTTCGHRELYSTHQALPAQVVIVEMDTLDGPRCPRCIEAYGRNPEVVRWVQGVVAKSQRDFTRMARTLLLDLLYEEKIAFMQTGVHEPPSGYLERKQARAT